jgi:hypothetical protein
MQYNRKTKEGDDVIEFTIPGIAPSTPNLREHWAAKAKRVKAQRASVSRKMPAWAEGPLLIVRLTRVGPRPLDTDNLAAALKGHRDAVAARLRVDDASPLVKWEYHQAKGEPAVVVTAWKAGQQVPAYLREVVGSIRAPRPHVDDRRPRKGMGHAIAPLVEMTPAERRKVAEYSAPRKGDAARARAKGHVRMMQDSEQWDIALPDGRRLRNKPRSGAKAGRADYVEAYTPPRSTPVDAAKEAEVFAPPATCCDTFRLLGRHHWSCTAPR